MIKLPIDNIGRPHIPDVDRERFWKRVDMQESIRPCWLWLGATKAGGYGVTTLFGRSIGAHRFAWIAANFADPGRLRILHSCDNPPCCNPRHLRPGTDEENRKDRRVTEHVLYMRAVVNDLELPDRRRQRPYAPERLGENHHRAKLREATVRALRDGFDSGKTVMQLAVEHGIASGHVYGIVHRRIWKSVP